MIQEVLFGAATHPDDLTIDDLLVKSPEASKAVSQQE